MFRTSSLVLALLLAAVGFVGALGRDRQRAAALGRGADRAAGKVERCVTCHVRPEEDPGGAHARASVGCSACHLGNPLAFDKARAHAGLEREPGALRSVTRTCGRSGCHVRNVLGERERAIHGNGDGCVACHVARRLPGSVPRPHPGVDARVTDDRCLACHAPRAGTRGALPETSPAGSGKAAAPADAPPACRAGADGHRFAGLSCIDCHLHAELMGDGTAKRAGRVDITCEACHGPVREGGETTWSEVRDPVSRDLLRQRGESREPSERVRLGRRGTPLWNLRPSDDGWTTTRKGHGVALATPSTPVDAIHVLRDGGRPACVSCHAVRAPVIPAP